MAIAAAESAEPTASTTVSLPKISGASQSGQ